jgi:hypothetical protein
MNDKAIESTQLLDAAQEMARALDFFDRVQASPESDREAVGRDHHDWVFRAARKVAEASNAELSGYADVRSDDLLGFTEEP